MLRGLAEIIRQEAGAARGGLAAAAMDLRMSGPVRMRFWAIALVIGAAVGLLAVGFRMAISSLQILFYGTDDVMLASHASTLPWWLVVAIPIMGGAAVGLILHFFTEHGRSSSVADVIEGALLKKGRVRIREGIASAVASLITLSTGGSTGREGPVVHIGAIVSSWISNLMRADAITARDLMGCAAAAAVSASFNAPIAGAIFALEVVLRHFAVHAFAPIIIASVTGTVASRLFFGDVTEFTLPHEHSIDFYIELPAFLLLGLVCGGSAVLLTKSVFLAERVAGMIQAAAGIRRWLRPAFAGLLLGLIAVWFPHIIGVGYETTSAALTGQLGLREAIVFSFVKAVAVVITIAGRMGGGMFSPSLMLGALAGLAFGYVATAVAPNYSGFQTLYALAGMGAMAAAVLGAPISTALIVFELTGDWQAGLAVLVCVSMSSSVSSWLGERSYFLSVLERRGLHVAAGPQAYINSLCMAVDIMRPAGALKEKQLRRCEKLLKSGYSANSGSTLDLVMPLYEAAGSKLIPVAERGAEGEEPRILGAVFQVDALKATNKALSDVAKEEHS